MKNMDALGYDAKNGGPLYKHFPFCIFLYFFFFLYHFIIYFMLYFDLLDITLCTKTNIAYGIFYDNLASAVFGISKIFLCTFYFFFYFYYIWGKKLVHTMEPFDTIKPIMEISTKFT